MKPKNLYDRLVLERDGIRTEIKGRNEDIKLESILEDFGKHVLEHYEENEDEMDSSSIKSNTSCRWWYHFIWYTNTCNDSYNRTNY